MNDDMFGRLQTDHENGYYLIGEVEDIRRGPYGDYFDGQVAVIPESAPPARLGDRLARLRSITHRRSELSSIPPPGWQVDGVMTRASLSLLSGKFGTYKSFVSVALAGSVATGRPFLGHRVVEQGPVVYIAAEGASGARGRFEAWESTRNDGAMIPDDRLVVVGGALNILNGDDVGALRQLCRRFSPRLIIWDTLHRCAPGLDENSSQEAGQVVGVLDGLREEFDCVQLVNHHTGHGGVRARGSSSWEDDFDNAWVIKLEGEDRSPRNPRTMEHRKVKDGELSKDIPIKLVPLAGSAYVDRRDDETQPTWLVATDYAGRLDRAGVPLTFGRERVTAALKAIGAVERLDNNMASSVAAIRKAPGYVPQTELSASADVCQTSERERL